MDDDAAGKCATLGSITSGILFSTGWFLFFGALARAKTDCVVWGGSWTHLHPHINCTEIEHNRSIHFHGGVAPDAFVSGAYWAPGILTTFGLIGLNVISWEAVVEEGSFGEGVAMCAKLWVMCSLILLFGGLGTGIWCFVSDFQTPNAWHWGGVMTLAQTLIIFASAILFRASRRSGDHAI